MQRHIAFLRGINVGGHRVTGAELAAVFSGLGFKHAVSFLASGNVIFDAPASATMCAAIESALEANLGYPVPTVLRTREETIAIGAEDPFTEGQLEASTGKLQVTLLAKQPTRNQAKVVLDLASADDLLALKNRELYWLPAAGISKSELDTKTILNTLGTQTTRTQNTIRRLTKKFLV